MTYAKKSMPVRAPRAVFDHVNKIVDSMQTTKDASKHSLLTIIHQAKQAHDNGVFDSIYTYAYVVLLIVGERVPRFEGTTEEALRFLSRYNKLLGHTSSHDIGDEPFCKLTYRPGVEVALWDEDESIQIVHRTFRDESNRIRHGRRIYRGSEHMDVSEDKIRHIIWVTAGNSIAISTMEE